MDILPAIDLRSGKCVRLLQGDYARQIDYGDDPVTLAQAFQDAGAKWLHVVDLDGALHGRMHNQAVIARILAATDLQVQVGGGIRREETVSQLLQLGVRQVVIGTRALEDMEWFEQIARTYSRQIVLGLDARQGKVATRGWKQESDITVQQMSKSVSDWPLAAIVYTDIACDGMLTGPNVDMTGQLATNCPVPIIASGGVGTLDHIRDLARLPIKGIIVGRALYEGNFTLPEALTIVA